MEKDKTKSCYNCKNFVRHYVKVQEIRFRKIDYGHCIVYRSYGLGLRGFPLEKGCERWEEDDREQEQKKNIKIYLRHMAERLAHIECILDDDEASENHKIQ